jgi:hypothetical protein
VDEELHRGRSRKGRSGQPQEHQRDLFIVAISENMIPIVIDFDTRYSSICRRSARLSHLT